MDRRRVRMWRWPDGTTGGAAAPDHIILGDASDLLQGDGSSLFLLA